MFIAIYNPFIKHHIYDKSTWKFLEGKWTCDMEGCESHYSEYIEYECGYLSDTYSKDWWIYERRYVGDVFKVTARVNNK